MLPRANTLRLCKGLINNSVIYNDKTGSRHYCAEWKKYMESSDRLTRIIERRDRVKEYVVKKDREKLLSYRSVILRLYGENRPEKWSLENMHRWAYYKSLNVWAKRQVYKPAVHHKLGPDLGAANFILGLEGRVKFRNFVHWTEKVDSEHLPKEYDPSYVLSAIDASAITLLQYEGLDNILGLSKLKWLSVSGCSQFDDWCLDRISAEYPALEYLDISNCKSITERGLESLYKVKKLKTLIVTNFNNSVALKLTCALLEDCIPGLTCEIHVPVARQIEAK